MAGLLWSEIEKPFVKGSSKPNEEETIESRIKKEIFKKKNIRIGSKYITNIELINVVIEEAKKCNNPDSNYYYKGTATAKIHKTSEEGEKAEYQEFTACNISGYALIDENHLELVGGTSIDSGLPNNINFFL